MKILVVVNEFPPGPGGVGNHAYQLSTNLAQKGHSVAVVCEQRYTSIQDAVKFNQAVAFPVYPYANRGGYLAKIAHRLWILIKTIRKHRPEVVIASGSNSVWLTSFYRLFTSRFRLVVVAHGGELNFRPWIRKALTHWGCGVADHIISVSNYTKGFLPVKLASKTTVIHNGADGNHFVDKQQRAAYKDKFGYSGKLVLLTVGSVSERKGQDVVIRAMKEVLESCQNVVYLMAGRSNNFDLFRAIAEKEGVQENVVFLGPVDGGTLVELYNAADLYVIGSRHSTDGDFEGFGISVIEAALCGLPAVVTNDSGLMEAIEDGVTGISVPSNDPQSMAAAIVRLLDEKARSSMGIEARKRAVKAYTWETVAASYNDLLLTLK